MFLKVILIMVFMLGLSSGMLRAQEATIIDIQGTVLVREDSTSEWKETTINKTLGSEASVKTLGDSICILAFDKKKMNILTVKDHTEIKINSVVPGNVYLSEGRVFTLIKNIKESKNFEVRTPTAVSGARGTGWLTEVIAGETRIACFDDVVYVESLNDSGEVTGQIDLSQGKEINVQEKGVIEKDVKEVQQVSLKEWKSFSEEAHHFAVNDKSGVKPIEGQVPPSQNKIHAGLFPEHQNIKGNIRLPEKGGDGDHEDFALDKNHNDGYADAQHETNQTMIEHNLSACGHYCCPFPQCCNNFVDPMKRNFCMSH